LPMNPGPTLTMASSIWPRSSLSFFSDIRGSRHTPLFVFAAVFVFCSFFFPLHVLPVGKFCQWAVVQPVPVQYLADLFFMRFWPPFQFSPSIPFHPNPFLVLPSSPFTHPSSAEQFSCLPSAPPCLNLLYCHCLRLVPCFFFFAPFCK